MLQFAKCFLNFYKLYLQKRLINKSDIEKLNFAKKEKVKSDAPAAHVPAICPFKHQQKWTFG